LSRVGKVPIQIPKGVEVKVDGLKVLVKGPKGQTSQDISADIKAEVADDQISFSPLSDSQETKAKWGLYRVLVRNMIVGVTAGYTKELDIVGVGYKAELKGKSISVSVGHSHPVIIEPKGGVAFAVQGGSRIVITGIDKQAVGQVAAEIRHVRPPEPYKGKGVRYVNEAVRKKAGKTGATASK
jgi:large subunit ribosomal protein L6